MLTHPLFGQYRINKNPYRIIFKDGGVNYTRQEAEQMKRMSDEDKRQVHLFKEVFPCQIM